MEELLTTSEEFLQI